MSGRYSPYNMIAGLGVQLKRIKNGTLAQTRFTRYLESIERKSDDELHRLQSVELSKMMRHAVENIPFYMHLNGKLELSPESAHSDIRDFPIVTKKILGSEKEQFCDPKVPVIKSMYSGGTTMTRVSVDTDRYSETHMGYEYFNRMTGIYPGMSRFMISRHESTYVEGGPRMDEIDFISNRLSRTYFVNALAFNEEKLRKAYDFFIRSKAQIIKGNTAMIVEFAESIEKNGWYAPRVPIVFGSENTMLPEYSKILKRVFDSRIFNAYGATESGIVATQCEKGEGLHYIPVLHNLETLKDGKQTMAGETGSLIITSLVHYAMPIIRFQIGDYATPSYKKCSCGRTFPVLESIDGRLYETINTPIGSVVSIYEAKSIIDKYDVIEDFQIVQTSPESIRLHLKSPGDRLSDEETTGIKKELLELFECDVRIDIEYVSEVLKLASGKILRILSMDRYQSIIQERG